MAQSAELTDILVRHQVFVSRLASGEVRKFETFLREMDRALRLELSGDDLTEFSRRRLERLLREVDELLVGIFDDHNAALLKELQEFAEHEAAFSSRALTATIPEFEAVLPAVPQIRAAVLSNPLSVRGPSGGQLLQSFIEDWTAAERKAITGIIRRGVFEGQTNQEIIRAIRGTRALRYADGALNVTQRHAAAVVRTAVQHVSTVARAETFKRNEDIVKKVGWVSTLDNRTCPRCGALDGAEFPIDKGPRPPLHPQCRCTTIPILPDRLRHLNRGATRASKGAEGGRQVSAAETYYEWLKRQPAAFQDEAIGPIRAKLLRDGGLSATRFAALQLDKQFSPMTLEQMKALEPLAFARAGL